MESGVECRLTDSRSVELEPDTSSFVTISVLSDDPDLVRRAGVQVDQHHLIV